MHAIEPATALLSAWQCGDEVLQLSAGGLERLEGGVVLTRLSLDAVEAIYDVSTGSDVFDSDIEFSVIVAEHVAVVVPIACELLLRRVPEAWSQRLGCAAMIACYASSDAPRAWRAARWNPLSVPQVKLVEIARSDLDRQKASWLARRPMRTLTDYQDPAIAQDDADAFRARFLKNEGFDREEAE
jgi:hypothetical protein